MSGQSLQRASAISLVAHVMFFVLVLLISKRPISAPQKIYTVNIVTPKVEAPAKTAKAPEASPPPPAKVITKKTAAPEVPKPKEVKPAPAPAPRSPEKPKVSEKELKEYITERLSSLKAEKMEEESLTEKANRIESLKKLDGIRSKAASNADRAVGPSSEDKKVRILDEYLERVKDSIYDVWVFPDMNVRGLESTILITVMRNGTIVVSRFERSSGNKLFDRSAIKAIYKASPVERPPFGKNIEIGVRFIPDDKK